MRPVSSHLRLKWLGGLHAALVAIWPRLLCRGVDSYWTDAFCLGRSPINSLTRGSSCLLQKDRMPGNARKGRGLASSTDTYDPRFYRIRWPFQGSSKPGRLSDDTEMCFRVVHTARRPLAHIQKVIRTRMPS
ncbi:hypothetical protein BDP55DRAFT_299948 [Colletotrichum godetiae]|uniref:Uncharacterized protein n=1 Tax=Colletotrichum godetiae TaxID=1209918 RepID=A0AAJ0AUJ2_9PEZI|nr:uncharacterized protein BDP55DRAFT_299948 [Colletotrichum godetiae]KAK1690585.1 hypothetical protein BDP55DRAFT_299948 [Colletotrichum godetiae]